MATTFSSPDALLDAVGTELEPSEWVEIDQDRIDRFADATGDDQWIHVDPERASAGPFGATIAHGYLTLAITNMFLPQMLEVANVSMGVNYGVNKVRFPSPALVGCRLRGTGSIAEVTAIDGGVQTVVKLVVEIEGAEKPACVVESVSRFMS